MSLPSRPIMIRLPVELAKKFDNLCMEFRGLAPAAVMRMLVTEQLERETKRQIETVNRQVRKGTAKGEACTGNRTE